MQRDIDYVVVFQSNEEIVDGCVIVASFYSYDLHTQMSNPFLQRYSILFGIIEFGSIKWHYMNKVTNRIVICFCRLPRVAFISSRRQVYVFVRVIAIMIT